MPTHRLPLAFITGSKYRVLPTHLKRTLLLSGMTQLFLSGGQLVRVPAAPDPHQAAHQPASGREHRGAGAAADAGPGRCARGALLQPGRAPAAPSRRPADGAAAAPHRAARQRLIKDANFFPPFKALFYKPRHIDCHL